MQLRGHVCFVCVAHLQDVALQPTAQNTAAQHCGMRSASATTRRKEPGPPVVPDLSPLFGGRVPQKWTTEQSWYPLF